MPYYRASMPVTAITNPSAALLLICGSSANIAGATNVRWWNIWHDYITPTGVRAGSPQFQLNFYHGGTLLNQQFADLHIETRSLSTIPNSPGNPLTNASDAGRQYWEAYP